MSFVAEATRETAATPERVFDTLVHHDAWAAWMPASFQPRGRKLGTLRTGVRLRVRIAAGRVALPAKLEVTVAERPRTIAWRGGIPGLHALHRFVLEPLDTGGTRIRSEETWSGPLAGLLRPIVKPLAEQVGRDQIDALAVAAESAIERVSVNP